MKKTLLYAGILLLPAMFMLAAVVLDVGAEATDAGATINFDGYSMSGEGCIIKYNNNNDATVDVYGHGNAGGGQFTTVHYGVDYCSEVTPVLENNCPSTLGTYEFDCRAKGKLRLMCGPEFEAVCYY